MTTPLHDIIRGSRRLADSSKRMYLTDVDRWVSFAGSDPHAWTRYKAQEFYDKLITTEGLKPQSATRIASSLRYAAQLWAKLEGKPELDFTLALEFARDTRRKKRSALTMEQAKKLLLGCLVRGSLVDTVPETFRDFALFVVALETGMRQMSLNGMKIETTRRGNVVEGKTLSFPTTLVPIKGFHEGLAAVPLSDTAISALQPWLAWLRSQKITTGQIFRAGIRGSPSMWSTVQRRYVLATQTTYKTLYNLIVRRAKIADVGHIHPHLFRHTFVTWRLAAGVPPEQIAAVTLHRLKGDQLGTLYEYTDKQSEIAELARSHTPLWLADLVKEVT